MQESLKFKDFKNFLHLWQKRGKPDFYKVKTSVIARVFDLRFDSQRLH